jgi:3-deoxy-manno-octulosonate cytidylyltransferase (CMP-KDO synthetase)
MDVSVTVIIPARYASSRFPGKPLALLAGKPLIQHVYQGAATSPLVGRVLVAADDRRIYDAVRGFGGEAMMVEGAFRTGTDRVAAVARQLPGEIFVNCQGDEIALHHDFLTDVIRPFVTSEAGMGTLQRRLTSTDQIGNPGVVKVVTNQQGEALYFSRAPIPYVRDQGNPNHPGARHYLHLGVYIFRRDTLRRFAELPTGRLEDAEKLEQLRALEHGIPIRVWETVHPSLRIDTPEDLQHALPILTNLAQSMAEVRM